MSDTPRPETRCPQCGTAHPHVERLERELAEANVCERENFRRAEHNLARAEAAEREVAELRELLTDARLALRRVYNASGQPSGMRPLLDKFDAALNPPHAQGGSDA